MRYNPFQWEEKLMFNRVYNPFKRGRELVHLRYNPFQGGEKLNTHRVYNPSKLGREIVHKMYNPFKWEKLIFIKV